MSRCTIPDSCACTELVAAADAALGLKRAIVHRYLKELDAIGVIVRPHGRVQRVALEQVVPQAVEAGN